MWGIELPNSDDVQYTLDRKEATHNLHFDQTSYNIILIGIGLLHYVYVQSQLSLPELAV